MFLCDSCHGKGCPYCDWIHDIGGAMGRSRGPCESCGKIRVCIDCHCRNHKPKKEKK